MSNTYNEYLFSELAKWAVLVVLAFAFGTGADWHRVHSRAVDKIRSSHPCIVGS